jgi:hypothetical protein
MQVLQDVTPSHTITLAAAGLRALSGFAVWRTCCPLLQALRVLQVLQHRTLCLL